MDIPIRCPHCETKLVVEDDLIGQSVLCEECDKPFTVEAPLANSKPDENRRKHPRGGGADSDAYFDYEFDDNRPIRRRPRAKPNALVPMIFGGLLALAVALAAVALFFAFGFV